MFIESIVLGIVVLLIIIYINKKQIKGVNLLPYYLILLITPIYSILDRLVLVKVFGCGCVPSTQINMLNIAFNANDLRVVVYSSITILSFILGLIFLRKFESKTNKMIYIITILLVNIIISIYVCKISMWG